MRRALAAAAFAALCSLGAPAPAASLPPGWIADPTSGCRVWNNYPNADDRIGFQGHCAGGYAQGAGVVHWFSNGRNYETDRGYFQRGKLAGHAAILDERGAFYGTFANNRPNGVGTFRRKDGQAFSGVWKQGCFDHAGRREHFFRTAAECGFAR